MNSNSKQVSISGNPELVASRRHTIILTAVLLAIAVWGLIFQFGSGENAATEVSHQDRMTLFVSALAAEWGLFVYVWRVGLRRHGTRLRNLIGGRWGGWHAVLRDLALAALIWLAWLGLEHGWDLWLGPGEARSIGAYLPRGIVETVLWIAVSMSAGFCEEITFRGYFQQQFAALTGHRFAGVLLQALLFGVIHCYQGFVACIKITLFGLMYGALAAWRGSLRPGIAAHAWTDLWAGWLSAIL